MNNITIVIGERNGGKTSTAVVLKEKLKGLRGFISLSEGEKDEITLLDLDSGDLFPLMSRYFNTSNRIGYYHILKTTFDYANSKKFNKGDRVIIDEIGMLEIRGGGFDTILRNILKEGIDVIITVRREYLEMVLKHYDIEMAKVVDVSEIENPAII